MLNVCAFVLAFRLPPRPRRLRFFRTGRQPAAVLLDPAPWPPARVSVGSVPVRTNVPAEQPCRRFRCAPSSIFQPGRSRRSQARAPGACGKSRLLGHDAAEAVVAAIASASAASSASIRIGMSRRAALQPLRRFAGYRAQEQARRSFRFDSSIASMRFSALFLPKRSRRFELLCRERVQVGGRRTESAPTSCSKCRRARPSMSIASLEAKWIRLRSNCGGTAGSYSAPRPHPQAA